MVIGAENSLLRELQSPQANTLRRDFRHYALASAACSKWIVITTALSRLYRSME